MSPSTAVLVNPNSGSRRRNRALAAHMARRCGRAAEVIVTRDTDHLHVIASELATAGTERVGIVGGDGTASDTVSALYAAYGEQLPQIALLRGGTMNTIANSVGVPRHAPTALLDRALQHWSRRRPSAVQVRRTLRIEGRLGFLFGTGLFSNFLREYYRLGEGRPTARTAAELLSRCAASALTGGRTARRLAAPATLEVELDAEQWAPQPYLMVGAGTVEHVGLGFRAYHRARERHDAFHVLALTGSAARLARDLPRIFAGLGVGARTGRERVSQQLVLRPVDGRLHYGLDGDLHESAGPVRVTLGPPVSLVSSDN